LAIRIENIKTKIYIIGTELGSTKVTEQLEAMEVSHGNNTKIVIPTGNELVNITGGMTGIVHKPKTKKANNPNYY